MLTFIDYFLQLINAAFTFDRTAFIEIYTLPYANWLTLTVLILTALSQTIGQSIVLLINQVSRLRFGLSILISFSFYVIELIVWTFIAQQAALWLFEREISLSLIFYAIALGQIPLIFSFTILLPYIGLLIRHILQVWTFLTVTVALTVIDLPMWQIFTIAMLGWAIPEIVYATMGSSISAISNWMWYLRTGKRTKVSVKELSEMLLRGERYVR